MALRDLKDRHRQAAIRRRHVVAAIGSGTAADADICTQVGRLIAELGCDLLTGELARRYGVDVVAYGGSAQDAGLAGIDRAADRTADFGALRAALLGALALDRPDGSAPPQAR